MRDKNKLRVSNAGFVILPQIKDGIDGTITVAEYDRHIPFPIKRVYYIHNLMNDQAIRGKHAHRQQEQVFFCISGSCEVELDDGKNRQIIHLEKPNVGIFMGTELWITLKGFSENCLLLVLASDIYKESDYIRDYEEFTALVKQKNGKG